MRYHDLTHQTFGRLTVIEPAQRPKGIKSRDKYWHCHCLCGNECNVAARNLKSGHTESCGCLQRERAAKSAKELHTRHGCTKTKEYDAWNHMKNRCLNPDDPMFPYYGARGISICERWLTSFENFLSDIGPAPSQSHSLDRTDNDGNYAPGNVRWATDIQQSRNRRDRKLITFNGKTQLLADWAAETGITLGTLWSRLYEYGWSVKRALTTDPNAYHHK